VRRDGDLIQNVFSAHQALDSGKSEKDAVQMAKAAHQVAGIAWDNDSATDIE